MNKEEILNRLIQKSICINAGGEGYYSPYRDDTDWFSDIDNLILMYEKSQQENKELKERIEYLERSCERKDESNIELYSENVDLVIAMGTSAYEFAEGLRNGLLKIIEKMEK